MSLEDLKKQFIIDEDALKARLEPILVKIMNYCRIDKNGNVLITGIQLSGKDRVKLVLSARAIAAQLDANISPEVSSAEIQKYAGLPANQVHARVKDAIVDKFAEAPKTGTYRAFGYKIEGFLDEISKSGQSSSKKN